MYKQLGFYWIVGMSCIFGITNIFPVMGIYISEYITHQIYTCMLLAYYLKNPLLNAYCVSHNINSAFCMKILTIKSVLITT